MVLTITGVMVKIGSEPTVVGPDSNCFSVARNRIPFVSIRGIRLREYSISGDQNSILGVAFLSGTREVD